MDTPKSNPRNRLESNTDYPYSLKEQVKPAKVRVEWPELSTLSKYVRRSGWQGRPVPSALSQFPDDLQISEKLQLILTWSLIPGKDWPTVPSHPSKGARSENLLQTCRVEAADNSLPTLPAEVARKTSTSQPTKTTVSHSISRSARVTKTNWRSRIFQRNGRADPVSPVKADVTQVQSTAECISCFDDLPEQDLIQLKACRHSYCQLCLTTLITTAMASESSFPPKCCLSTIPLNTVLLSLSTQQRQEYQAKSAEYSVPPSERIYCPNTSCLKWIPPSKLKVTRMLNYRCPHCSKPICRICRGPAHAAGSECPQDFGIQATLEVAQAEGWQRCYSCHVLVEQTQGCHHMTCKCKAQFCYVCGARWRTCRCTETDANRKRANVQERRQNRMAALDAEAEELATAIAEVQELERREAEERRVEEERIAREEAEMLAALELQRQQEEAARRAAAEQAERDWLRAVRTSFEDECEQMQSALTRIAEFQKGALISKHETEQSTKLQEYHKKAQGSGEMVSLLHMHLLQRYQTYYDLLMIRHADEVLSLANQQEKAEDDAITKIRELSCNPPEHEASAATMLDELRQQQEEQRQNLRTTQKSTLRELQSREDVDIEGLRRVQGVDEEYIRAQHELNMQRLGFSIGADRHYFHMVTRRRLTMLAKHKELGFLEIEQKLEPVGLQEWHAAVCEPVLPEIDDGSPGSSGSSRVDQDGLQDVNGLCRDRTPCLTSGWMTSASEEQPTTSTSTYDAEIPTLVSDISIPGSFPTESLETPSIVDIPHPIRAPPNPPSSHGSLEGIFEDATSSLSLDSTSLTPQSSLVAEETSASDLKCELTQGAVTLPAALKFSTELEVAFKSPGVRTDWEPLRMDAITPSAPEHSTMKFSPKTSKWLFRKTPKDITAEEIKARMKQTVGDAFVG